MLFLDNQYNFFVAMFGRKGSGKTSFMQAMMDRSEINILEVFENEDYFKVIYESADTGRMTVYNFYGMKDDVAFIPEMKNELSPLLNQLDYIFYFVDSLEGFSEFDRRFIGAVNEYEANVMCVINRSPNEDVNKVRMYTLQGDLGVPVHLCNCMNRPDVMNVNDMLTQFAKERISFDNMIDFFHENPKRILFIMPITIASHMKNRHARYYELLKSLVESDGMAVCINSTQVKGFFEEMPFRPDAIVAGDKLLLNIRDIEGILNSMPGGG